MSEIIKWLGNITYFLYDKSHTVEHFYCERNTLQTDSVRRVHYPGTGSKAMEAEDRNREINFPTI